MEHNGFEERSMNGVSLLPVTAGALPESPRVGGKFRKFELHPPSRGRDSNPHKNLKLVPSRWSHTGWRYCLDEPKD